MISPTNDTSAIWYTRWPGDTDAQVNLHADETLGLDSLVEFCMASREFRLTDKLNAPRFLFSEERIKLKSAYQDAFNIVGGILVVSRKLRDVLMESDLGSSQLYRVPIHLDEKKTPSGYEPHYVLHVTEQKQDTFVPAESSDVRQAYKYGTTELDPNSRWGPLSMRDHLAVRAESAAGVDLWADPKLGRRLFLSDRLKQAINDAKVTSRALDFQEAILV